MRIAGMKSSGPQPPVATIEPAALQPGALRILLVEDIPVQRKLLERMLQNMGHAVETASDGAQALARILEETFDVLITDWDMPGMDGPTLCSSVRKADLDRYIFIFMLTSHDSVPDFVAGLGSGADQYVRKPAQPDEMRARLKVAGRIVQLERDLRAAKASDSLLKIYNRDYLDDHLPREIERARRYGLSLSLVMADVDRFKLINDAHGHRVGDEALKGFCKRARASIRQSIDWIARYGGEEFAIVLPQTDVNGALCMAEKMRGLCAESPIQTSVGPLSVTVSLGVAGLLQDGDAKLSATQMLHRADKGLYQSKRDGRNRVNLWVPE
jgi:two-component system cell cycle response regulator